MLISYTGESERIDTWLSKEFSYSRNFFHHIIGRWGVQVNGKTVKKSQKLKEGDQIFIDNLERYLSPIILEEAPEIDIPILLEEENYLIINKPKGVLSHPNSVRDANKPSVVGFLYHHFKDLPSYGNFIRAGLIHRLDKDTDGIMVIAKTEKGLEHFKALFQQKSENASIEEKEAVPLQKFYRATCEISEEGATFLESIQDQLPYYISEEVIAKAPNTAPKLWITKIESILPLMKGDKGGSNSWWTSPLDTISSDTPSRSLCGTGSSEGGQVQIFLQILTWRTHQIRYHLSNKGLPILWDYLYGKESDEAMQLTAYKLLYQDLDGEIRTIEI